MAEKRERREFGELLQGTDGTVILFGAGRLGRLCARALRQGSVPLQAFCDGNVDLRGQCVEGVEVLDLMEAIVRFGPTSLFVIAIWSGTARESMDARIRFLRGSGCRTVTTYAPLVWAYHREEMPFHSFDLPSRVLAQATAFRRLAGLLADEASRTVLLRTLQQRLHGRFESAPPAADQYFPSDIVALQADEIVVDGGAFAGDTLADFIRRTGGRFAEYHAFEPDAGNADRLRDLVRTLPDAVRARVWVHQVALHSSRTRLAFSSNGLPTSRTEAGANTFVQAESLDETIRGAAVTFLKLDVEGAEEEALAGAAGILGRHRPRVAVCVYHGPEDVWRLPLLLHEAIPRHLLFLRQHAFDGWEMVCYAIPAGRLPGPLQ